LVTINMSDLYGDQAKLDQMPAYIERAKEMAGQGRDVVLTGPGPVWLYLAVAHGLHGLAKSLAYDSPVTGKVKIFDHNPY